MVTFFLLAVGAGILFKFIPFDVPELRYAGVSHCILFIFKALPVFMMITMMQTALYELVSGTVSAILLQFLVAVGLGYISGCFYPNYFFPDFVQNLASLLPSGVGFSYLRKLMSGTLLWQDILSVLSYFTLFAAITVFIRKHRIAGDKQ